MNPATTPTATAALEISYKLLLLLLNFRDEWLRRPRLRRRTLVLFATGSASVAFLAKEEALFPFPLGMMLCC